MEIVKECRKEKKLSSTKETPDIIRSMTYHTPRNNMLSSKRNTSNMLDE